MSTGETNSPQQTTDEKILYAAKRLFIRFGYDKTTLNDVAAEVGISKSTLYARWGKKETLFGAVLWRESLQYSKAWFARIEADPQGGTFAAIYKNALLALQDNEFILLVYNRDRRILGSYLQRPELNGLYEQRTAMSANILAQFQVAGLVRADVDPAIVSFVMTSLQVGLLRMGELIPPERLPNLEAIMEVTTDMINRYLEPPTPADPEIGRQIVRQMMQQVIALLEGMINSAAQGDT